MADQRLDQLKAKYQSVLNLVNQLGVQLQNLHLQDNKLFIKGQAKSKADSDKIWNQIKLVDSNYQQDLTAQFAHPDVAPVAAPAQPAAAPAARTYTVKAGDTLSKIAKEFYGNASQYMRIFEANKDKLSDPDKIRPGQVLNIP